MQLVLAGLNYESCLVYIDDIIIFAKTLEDHLRIIEEIMQRLEKTGLKIRPDKCIMLQKKVKFLGHVMNKDGIKTSPKKTEAVANWLCTNQRSQKYAHFLVYAGIIDDF